MKVKFLLCINRNKKIITLKKYVFKCLPVSQWYNKRVSMFLPAMFSKIELELVEQLRFEVWNELVRLRKAYKGIENIIYGISSSS